MLPDCTNSPQATHRCSISIIYQNQKKYVCSRYVFSKEVNIHKYIFTLEIIKYNVNFVAKYTTLEKHANKIKHWALNLDSSF